MIYISQRRKWGLLHKNQNLIANMNCNFINFYNSFLKQNATNSEKFHRILEKKQQSKWRSSPLSILELPRLSEVLAQCNDSKQLMQSAILSHSNIKNSELIEGDPNWFLWFVFYIKHKIFTTHGCMSFDHWLRLLSMPMLGVNVLGSYSSEVYWKNNRISTYAEIIDMWCNCY